MMPRIVFLGCIAACVFFVVGIRTFLWPVPIPASITGPGPLFPLTRWCGDPCVINRNYGGRVDYFMSAANVLPFRKEHGAIIDGPCYSACTMFAAFGRPHVCITKKAIMYFHRGSDEMLPESSAYPQDIMTWVNAHGGWPTQRSGRFTRMPFNAAKQFWPVCNTQVRA